MVTRKFKTGLSEILSDAQQIALEFEEALDMKLKKKDRSKAKRTTVTTV